MEGKEEYKCEEIREGNQRETLFQIWA